jgi:hypothetical protein
MQSTATTAVIIETLHYLSARISARIPGLMMQVLKSPEQAELDACCIHKGQHCR